MFSRHLFRVALLGLGLAVVANGFASALAGSTRIAEAAAACASLTPMAIQQVIDKIDVAIASETEDVRVFGATGPAPGESLAGVQRARDSMVQVQTWLRTNGYDTPYVTNTTGAYNVHGHVHDTIGALHWAQHWAMISAVQNRSYPARTTYEATVSASVAAMQLGPDAGRCYMLEVFP